MALVIHMIKEKKYELGLFISVTFINAILSLQGIDITSTGFHLTNQYFLINDLSSIAQITAAPFILSNFIGGVWLHLIPYPWLLWARLGGIFLISFTSLFTYYSLIRDFNQKESFIAVFSSTILISSLYHLKLIDSYTFPAFLSVLILYYFGKLRFFNQKRICKSECIVLGLLFFLIIISRISALLLIIGLIFYIFLYFFVFDKHFFEKEELFFTGVGFFISFIFFIGLLFVNGQMGNYLTGLEGLLNLFQSSADGHDMNNIWYQFSLFRYFIGSTGGFLLLYFIQKYNSSVQTIHSKFLFFISITVSVLIISKIIFDESNEYIFFFSPLWACVTGFTIASYCVVKKYHWDKEVKYIYIFEIGILFSLLTPIGSDTGLFRVLNGWWIPLSYSLVQLSTLFPSYNIISNRNKKLFFTIIIGIILLSGVIFYVGIYRDSSNRSDLISGFDYPSLYGIYSTGERVKSLDEFLWVINNSSDEDDIIFFSGYSSLNYFVNRAPFSGDPWLSKRSNSTILWELSHQNQELFYPDLYGYSKFSAVYKYWPVTMKQLGKCENNSIIDELLIKDGNYSKIFENDFFILYKSFGYKKPLANLTDLYLLKNESVT